MATPLLSKIELVPALARWRQKPGCSATSTPFSVIARSFKRRSNLIGQAPGKSYVSAGVIWKRVCETRWKTGTGCVRGPIETLPGAMGIASSHEAPRNHRKRGCLIYSIRMSSGKMGIIPLTPFFKGRTRRRPGFRTARNPSKNPQSCDPRFNFQLSWTAVR